MCLHKRIINNPVKFEHLTGFDKPVIKVACGKCPECKKQKCQDWIFRSFWEFQSSKVRPFFVTLTYDDLHLPYYHGKPVFNHFHLRAFLDRLKKTIFGKFRYLIVCEYGGLFRRPHYHMIVIPEKEINQLTAYYKLRDCWWYGDMLRVETLPSVKGDMMRAASYICNYTSKDPLFDVDDYETDFPSHHKSRIFACSGYGKSFFDILDRKILEQGFYYLPIGKNGTDMKFRIPRYYEMKMTFDYSYNPDDRSVELKKNQLGLELAVLRHNSHYNYFKNLVNSSFVNLIGSDIGAKYGYPNFADFAKYCLSKREFSRYLYIRDFITDSFETISQTKYDPVFEEFYQSSSVLDEKDFSKYVNTFISDSSEKIPFCSMFEDFMSVIDDYNLKVDLDRSFVLSQREYVLSRKRLYAKLRSRPSLMRRYLHFEKSRFDIKLDKVNQYCFTFNY